MASCFINSVGCVSAQQTVDNSKFLEDIQEYTANVIEIIKPNYKEYMQGASARRMAKGVKMGIVASAIALKEAGVEEPDAIITGTGMGCLIDSEKFLSAIIDNDEEFLTPTSFIQSTHNTVGAQIALGLKCKSYNFTYVHAANSFESSLLDAQMMLQEFDATNILVGGVDELADHTIKIHKLIDHIKQEEVHTSDLYNSGTKGSIFGEGASFFVVSNTKQENCYAELIDIVTLSDVSIDNLEAIVSKFLEKQHLTTKDIDGVVLGMNGDVDFDPYFHRIRKDLFKNTTQLSYKHLSGEYNTASAFGFWVACKILKNQNIPDTLMLNSVPTEKINHLLLYNQYRGKNHSFILLKAC